MKDSLKLVLQNSSILLVEDEVELRASFKKVLQLYVKEVYEAGDGKEALDIFRQKSIDIIFSDVKMPKVDGIDFIKQIRELDSTIPIVITSAYSDKNYLLESIKLSLVDYLIKPIKEKELSLVLEGCAEILAKSNHFLVQINNNISYNFFDKVLTIDSKEIDLTIKELEFLELLLRNRGHLVTKSKIESELYVFTEAPPSAVKNLVFKLRKKIGNDIIRTKGQLGYFIESL